jgi:hypothetical protein
VRQAARRRQHRYVWSVIWIRLTGSVWCVCTGRNMTRTWSSPRSMCPETNGSTACLSTFFRDIICIMSTSCLHYNYRIVLDI